MRFKVNQNVASPIKVTIRDQQGVSVDLATYDSVSVDFISPYEHTTTVAATKFTNDISVDVPPLSVAGLWHMYIALKRGAKTDYSDKIEIEVI